MRFFLFAILTAACANPPAWTVPRQQLQQGETVIVPIPFEAVEVTIASAPDGLEAFSDNREITLRARYSLSGLQKVIVRLDDHQGGVSDVPIEVEVTPLAWKWKASFSDGAPSAREHASFVVDDDVAYLLGGSGYAPQGEAALDAYWTWDLQTRTWSVLTPAGDVPPPAASRRVAQIPGQKLAYLFGGYESPTRDNNDLYRFDYSVSPPVFTRLSSAGAPPPRELHAFAYDPGSDTFIVFGGYSSDGGVLGDTWLMKLSGDKADWSQIGGPGPTPRYGFFYAASDGALYVWSGAQKVASIKPASDTWVLSIAGTIWRPALYGSEPNAPLGRRNGTFVFDPEHERLAIFGGTADGATTVPGLTFLDLKRLAWDTVTLPDQPDLRSSGFGFYDPKRKEIVMGFGNDRRLYRDLAALGY